MYCGSSHYQSAIKFVLQAFKKSKAEDNNIKLLIITYGNNNDINKIKNFYR